MFVRREDESVFVMVFVFGGGGAHFGVGVCILCGAYGREVGFEGGIVEETWAAAGSSTCTVSSVVDTIAVESIVFSIVGEIATADVVVIGQLFRLHIGKVVEVVEKVVGHRGFVTGELYVLGASGNYITRSDKLRSTSLLQLHAES